MKSHNSILRWVKALLWRRNVTKIELWGGKVRICIELVFVSSPAACMHSALGYPKVAAVCDRHTTRSYDESLCRRNVTKIEWGGEKVRICIELVLVSSPAAPVLSWGRGCPLTQPRYRQLDIVIFVNQSYSFVFMKVHNWIQALNCLTIRSEKETYQAHVTV